MHNQRDEQIIFIKDLIFAALYQWRKILAVAVTFALLLGGWKVASGLPAGAGAPQDAQSTHNSLQEQIEAQSEYLENSYLMTMRPASCYRAVLNLSVLPEAKKTATVGYTSLVLKTYETRITQITGSEEFAQLAQVDRRYAAELASITIRTDSLTDGVLTVTLRHNDQTTAEKLLELIAQQIPAITKELTDSGAAHTLVSSQTVFQKLDTELQELQEAQGKYLDMLKEKLGKNPVVVAGGQAASVTAALKSGIIFAILGGIVGAFLMVCLFWAMHIFGNKVYSARTLTAWTGLKVLACVAVSERKNPIDRWLRKLEGRQDTGKLAIAAANVRNYNARETNLLISADSAAPEELVAVFATGSQTQVCGLLTEDVVALEALPGCTGVLLVLQCGKSRYHDILRQLQMIEDQGKNLLGCVLLDG